MDNLTCTKTKKEKQLTSEDYHSVQNMLEKLGSSLFSMVSSLVTVCEDLPNFPTEQVTDFINVYEKMYFFEKEKNLAPRFSRAT